LLHFAVALRRIRDAIQAGVRGVGLAQVAVASKSSTDSAAASASL
jgi:hypothetical protein